MNLKEEYIKIKNEIINIRRHIHRHPELSFEEYETAKTVCSFLDKYSIPYKSAIAGTGVCAYVGDVTKGKNILLRADMDALPFEEKSGLEFASENKGIMHACGHDIHTASLLAACCILKKHEQSLNGSVTCVFQPGEETTGGALPMIQEGILQNPKVNIALGMHVSPSYPTGNLYFKEGPLMASPDDFKVEFKGKSAHGAEPQNGINPIEAAAEFVCKIKEKLAEKLDLGENVFTVCRINGGTVNNIIPDKATVEGTFRSFDNNDRKNAEKVMNEYCKKLCEKYGTKYDLVYNYSYPPLINDKNVCTDAKSFAQKEFGTEHIKTFEKPLMTGEDFAYFAENIPSVFVWAGCKKEEFNSSLHSSEFVANEDVIGICARFMAGYAIEYLNK